MKLVYLITRSEYGGAQSHVLELIDGFRAHHEIALAVGEDGWLTHEVRKRDVPVTVIPDLKRPIRPVRDCLAFLQVKKWLARERPDLLHTHSSKAGLVGRIAARLSGVPSVYTAHGWAFTHGVALTRKLVAVPGEWLAARTGGDIICVSDFDRKLASRYMIAPNAKLHTVWNGIGNNGIQAIPGSHPDPFIIMVARFAAPKDHVTLLRAMAAMNNLRWRVRLVGDGPLLTDAQALASALGIESRVKFLGARPDVPELLTKSDLFVLASRFEGLPISVIEAMRAGLPVVASSVGGVPELVNSDTGILVPPEDPTALADALKRLLVSPDLLAEMGAEGRKRYEKDFRANSMIEKTIDVYRLCIQRRRKGQ